MNTYKLFKLACYRAGVVSLAASFTFLTPVAAFAQEATETTTTETTTTGPTEPTGAPETTTGPTEPTGATECTGAGCYQGMDQGVDQGVGQGGPTLEDLGGYVDENGNEVLPEGVVDTRQGASQGADYGTTSSADTSASNTNTGADSTNTNALNNTTNATTGVSNTANDTSTINASGTTGGNTGNSNTGSSGVTSGNASIGVTQVKNDNTTAIGGTVGLNTTGYQGDISGDLALSFENAISLLTGSGDSRSIQAINDTTGSGSTNDILLNTAYNELTEVQNDGNIDNELGLSAITGQNEASMNTGDGSITTGDANIAATLVNLLNTTVLNGALSIDVYDVFGNLNGNIVLPDLSQLAAILGVQQTVVDASNDTTGSNSTNDIDVTLNDTETTNITNDAAIDTNVTANAITGQNTTSMNTGGGQVTTGDASVQASNLSVANTTVEGGNWALVIVNAFNRWVGLLVGDEGQVQQLSQEETIRQIEAQNSNTGSDSENNIDITDTTNRETNVTNDATITNDIVADAITGQNEAIKNTGAGIIDTGDANITATAVNIANTVVKNATLGIAVVNIFGDWMGDLLYQGTPLLASLFGGAGTSADVTGANTNTGAESDNTIDVTANNTHETNIDNEADINTVLNANIDTGNNVANSNTGAGKIATGNGELALHSRTVANVTGIAGPGSLSLTFDGLNSNTGFDSNNVINAEINDNRIVDINNDANVSTIFGVTANTGGNDANMNTGGADITTGNIDADAEIHNLLNQVVIAFGNDGFLGGDPTIEVDVTALNELTGALSNNENNVTAARDFLLDIFNDATVDNILDFLLNTGNNTASSNTGPVSVHSGSICVEADITNKVNMISKLAGVTDGDIDNNADIDNDADVDANTGGNAANMNTQGGQGDKPEGCEKIAQAPEQPTPTPGPTGGGGGEENGGGGQGGGEDVPVIARIAGAKVAQAQEITEEMAEKVMERAAGVSALADTGAPMNRRLWLWITFTLAAITAMAGAMRADREAHARPQVA